MCTFVYLHDLFNTSHVPEKKKKWVNQCEKIMQERRLVEYGNSVSIVIVYQKKITDILGIKNIAFGTKNNNWKTIYAAKNVLYKSFDETQHAKPFSEGYQYRHKANYAFADSSLLNMTHNFKI